MSFTNFSEMVGKTMVSVVKRDFDGDELVFTCTGGKEYIFYHCQDCCESVGIEEVIGDLSDLVGSPILMAEEVSCDSKETDWGDETWTFYKFSTLKGYVTVRWVGNSNGYYSTSVDFRVN